MKVITSAALLAVLMLFGTSSYAQDCKDGGRYEDNNNGTVTDCRTGLVWLRNAKCMDTSNSIPNPDGTLNWSDAMKWVVGLYGDGSGSAICSLTDGSSAGDWRLPTKTEWMAMVQSANNQNITNPSLTNDAGTAVWVSGAGSSFTNVQPGVYWASTTLSNYTDRAWYIYMYDGSPDFAYKTNLEFVWPVRGGQSRSVGSVRIE